MVAEFLGLSEAQQADIKKIRTAARDQSQPLRKQLRDNRKALGEAVKSGETANIEALATEHGNLRGQLVAIGAKTRVDVKNVLTPEQQQKWTSFQEKRKSRREERRQRRHQRRGGAPGGEHEGTAGDARWIACRWHMDVVASAASSAGNAPHAGPTRPVATPIRESLDGLLGHPPVHARS